MRKIFLIITIFVALSKSCRVVEERANGATVNRDSYPGLVLLENYITYSNKYLCTGSLISKKFVLTTQHCVFGYMFVNVHIYAYKLRDEYENLREIHRSTNVLFNSNYDGLNRINDISLVEMPSTFYVTGKSYLRFVQLPTTSLNASMNGFTVGFGLLNYVDDHAASHRQQLAMSSISQAECAAAYPNLNWSNSQGRACIKPMSGKNCVSDVGSPFIVDGIIYGIQSFGQVEACDSEVPNLIQDIYQHIDWIKTQAGIA